MLKTIPRWTTVEERLGGKRLDKVDVKDETVDMDWTGATNKKIQVIIVIKFAMLREIVNT